MPDLISRLSPFASPTVEVYYGGQYLYPAPLIDYSKSFVRNAVDETLSVEETYTLHGIFLNSSGFYHQTVNGMNDLKSIFGQDRLEFEIRAGSNNVALPSGTKIVSGLYPVVQRINTPERNDQWGRFDYEIELLIKSATSGVSGVVSSAQNNWEVSEQAEDGSTRLTHRVSAVGINTATSGAASNALTNAKNYVVGLIGTGTLSTLPAFCSPPSGFGSNYRIYELTRSRSESFSTSDGTYEVSEVFILVSGILPYTHSRTFDWNRNKDGIVDITINGTIQGAGRTDGTTSQYNAFYFAQSGYLNTVYPALGTDASGIYSSYGGSGTLNVNNPTTRNVTENRYLGTVSYSITYTDNPADNLPSGIAEQSLTIRRDDPITLIASHIIPQRRLGNILQNIGTPTEGRITITARIKAINTGDNIADTNTALSYAQDLINQNRPNPNDFITLRLESVSVEPDKLNLSVDASVVYIFTIDLAQVPQPDSDITFNPVT